MHGFIYWLVAIGAGLISLPIATFCLEVIVGITRRPVPTALAGDRSERVTVLVPAHNESVGIRSTIENIRAQLHSRDLLLVVADNCTDDTAKTAGTAGAMVLERRDVSRIGKGYALDFGLRHLENNPPDFVVMVDADCQLAPGTIDRLVSASARTGRPTQALYLMTAPDGTRINLQIAEFAWRVKNWVRPLGLSGLGLPCQLMGTGMAFPWQVIRCADLASGCLVEDLKLGLDLAAAGHPPLFCPSARVTSQFASSARGVDAQHKRWEHGHLGTILTMAPGLLWTAITQGKLGLFALTLDLAVPPLSFLATLLLLMFMITGLTAALGVGSTALVMTASCLVGFTTVVCLAWGAYGRDVLPSRAVLSLPNYVLGKLGIYYQALFGNATSQWIRTDRAKF